MCNMYNMYLFSWLSRVFVKINTDAKIWFPSHYLTRYGKEIFNKQIEGFETVTLHLNFFYHGNSTYWMEHILTTSLGEVFLNFVLKGKLISSTKIQHLKKSNWRNIFNIIFELICSLLKTNWFIFFQNWAVCLVFLPTLRVQGINSVCPHPTLMWCRHVWCELMIKFHIVNNFFSPKFLEKQHIRL